MKAKLQPASQKLDFTTLPKVTSYRNRFQSMLLHQFTNHHQFKYSHLHQSNVFTCVFVLSVCFVYGCMCMCVYLSESCVCVCLFCVYSCIVRMRVCSRVVWACVFLVYGDVHKLSQVGIPRFSLMQTYTFVCICVPIRYRAHNRL